MTSNDNNRQHRLQKMKRHKTKRAFILVLLIILLTTGITVAALKPWNSAVHTGGIPTVDAARPTPTGSFLPSESPNTSSTRRPHISLEPGVSATPACTPAANFNKLINTSGDTIGTRFRVPDGWERVYAEPGSFAEYLRNLPLKADGAKLLYWDGNEHSIPAHAAILDRETPKKFEQCADTVIHLYSDYLYQTKQYDKISFTFNNGFVCDFMHFTQGYRPNEQANGWETRSDYWTGITDRVYKVYLEQTFLYANTASLYDNDLDKVEPENLSIGDLFIVPGFPGHVIIVADMIQNKSTGEKRFITVQGSMPAVQAHVMMNAEEPELSPWQNTNFDDGYFYSATYWNCPIENIRRFR